MDKPELETLDYKPPKSTLSNENGGVLANPEQPNTNIIIVKTIQSLITLINNNLEKLREGITNQVPGDSCHKLRVLQALEEIDLFERTTLYELQKAFE